MTDQRLIWVTEVHNYGGFFGGDTVTLTGVPWPGGEELPLTIDEKALEGIQGRHTIVAEMLLELAFSGERVDRARLIGAKDLTTLNDARGNALPATILERPRIRTYYCSHCALWIAGQPRVEATEMHCLVCNQMIN